VKIKFIDRGFKEHIVLIPGWATDWRIFAELDLNYNYLLPVEFDPFNFERELIEQLDKLSLDKISLFGWSMGGFLAAGFSANNPQRVHELIFLSIRQKHDPLLLKDIESKLKAGKNAYLYKFYLA
jgi:pimeloyl-ACP methyl ester carboxylesterase